MSTDVARSVTLRVLPLEEIHRTVRCIGFWLAVGLPLAYLPLLWSSRAGDHPALLVGTLTINLLALAVGHGHEPSLGRRG